MGRILIMKAIWVIQENLNNDDKELLPVLEGLGIGYRLIKIIPFSDSVPEVDYEGPKIARGSTTTLKGVEKMDWKPGVWHNPNFSTRYYQQTFQRHYANWDGMIFQINELSDKVIEANFADSQHMFVRPNTDYKDFTGTPMTKREIQKLVRNVNSSVFPFPETAEVMIAPICKISDEYRLTVVNGEIVAGYSYRIRGSRRIGVPAPQKVTDFAKELPLDLSEVFSLDIGITKDGPKVVEANCFNASGIYGGHETIVQRVTDFVNQTYGS